MSHKSFGWADWGIRFVAALLLAFATWNPSDYSWAGWVFSEPMNFGPLEAVASILLLIGWAIFLRATWGSLGVLGLLLAAALVGSIVWLLWDLGALGQGSLNMWGYVAVVGVALIMSIGLSWSHVRRRLSGQIDADEIEH